MRARATLPAVVVAIALASGCGGDPALGEADVEQARADLAEVAAHCEEAPDAMAARQSVDSLIRIARADPTARLDDTPMREVLASLVRDLADGCDDELAAHLDEQRASLE